MASARCGMRGNEDRAWRGRGVGYLISDKFLYKYRKCLLCRLQVCYDIDSAADWVLQKLRCFTRLTANVFSNEGG